MLCARCHTVCPDRAKFCGECGAALASAPVAVDGSGARCQTCGFENSDNQRFCGGCGVRRGGATGEMQRRSLGPAAAELKIVTVLFCDVSGFTSLSEDLDPEELRDLMDGWFERLGRVVRRHGGTIDKFIGDAVMALFGAPVAHEDDPRRAIDAALDMQEAIQEYNAEVRERVEKPLAIRVGINTGRVYAGIIGGEGDRAYTVMGDAVNVASRLESECPVGSILISESSYRHVRDRYEVLRMEPLTVKGKSEALIAYQVLGVKRHSLAISGEIGLGVPVSELRQRELLEVVRAFARTVSERRPELLLVIGEPGMGKGPFLRQAAGQLSHPGMTLLAAHCEEDAGAAPLQLLVDLLGRAAGVPGAARDAEAARRLEHHLGTLLGDGAAESIRLLCHTFGLDQVPLGRPAALGDPQTLMRLTFEAARAWLRALAQRGPLVVRIDNLHGAPEQSRLLLQKWLEEEGISLLIIASSTPAGADAPSWQGLLRRSDIRLGPLGPEESLRAARQLLAPLSPPHPELAARVAERSGGNPGFMEETVRALLDRGILQEQPFSGWRLAVAELPDPLPLPETIGQMVQARVDRLSRSAKRALQWAAVAGPRFSAPNLVPLSGGEGAPLTADHVEAALFELCDAHLVTRTEALARDGRVLYRFRLALTRELVYEGIIARSRREWHKTLAEWHLNQGERFEELDPAVLDEVGQHYLRAGELLAAARAFLRAGDSARAVFANRDARNRYQRAADALVEAEAPPATLAAAFDALTDVCILEGDHQAAITALGQALALVPAPPPGSSALDEGLARARLLTLRGRCHDLAHERALGLAAYEEAIALLGRDRAAALAGPLALEWRRALATALQRLGWSRYLEGQLDAAEALFREGLESCAGVEAPLEIASLEDGMGAVARARGDLAVALEARHRALARREQAGDRRGMAASHVNIGVIHFIGGDYAAARQAWSEALRLHEENGNLEGIGMASQNLGAAELELGNLAVARAYLTRSRDIALRAGLWFAAESLRYLAEVSLAEGDVGAARQLCSEGMERLGESGPVVLRGSLLTLHAMVLGRSGEAAEARARFGEAIATLESVGNSLELGIACHRYGELLWSNGESAAALEQFQRARARFGQVGNHAWMSRSDAVLASLAPLASR